MVKKLMLKAFEKGLIYKFYKITRVFYTTDFVKETLESAFGTIILLKMPWLPLLKLKHYCVVWS